MDNPKGKSWIVFIYQNLKNYYNLIFLCSFIEILHKIQDLLKEYEKSSDNKSDKKWYLLYMA